MATLIWYNVNYPAKAGKNTLYPLSRWRERAGVRV
jgi:hypothetical protein